MNDEYNGELKFGGNTLFWREYHVVNGKRVYGRFRKTAEINSWEETNLEAVTVADLWKDLYDALWNALCEKLDLKKD